MKVVLIVQLYPKLFAGKPAKLFKQSISNINNQL